MSTTQTPTLLQVKDLSVSFPGEPAYEALQQVSFQLNAGKSLALLGASGSGKSVTSLAIMCLLPGYVCVSGSILLDGQELLAQQDMSKIRGKSIAMIFQEPMTALNPIMTCGAQLMESIATHQQHLSTKVVKEQALYWLNQVQLPNVATLFHKYPHELSGGQKQRIMIAMALCNRPKLIIADEPTTALDVLVQKEILDLLKLLQREHQCALLFITHDMGVAQYIADEVCILSNGKVVGNDLQAYRSSFVIEKEQDDLSTLPTTPLLKMQDVSIVYATGRMGWGSKPAGFKAVDNVSLEIPKGTTLGLVGGSGSGKSTVSKCIMGITPISSGDILFDGSSYQQFNKQDWKKLRKEMQMIFQDPHASLSPKMNVATMLSEVIEVHKIVHGKEERIKFIHNLLDKVGLPSNAMQKYPYEFSGGQKQRLCIARALAVNPQFIICDESIAALDTKMQYQILNLLKDIQTADKLTYLFITHDLRVAEMFSDTIAVMKEGKLVEYGSANEVLSHPQHDYTQSLIAAML